MPIVAILILGIAVLAATWAAWSRIPDGWLLGQRHSRLARIWRSSPGVLLAAYLFLSLAAVAATVNSHPPLGCPATGGCRLPPSYQLGWVPVVIFLTWRVSRGGRISRILLIIWSGAGYAAVATTIARAWNPLTFALLAVQAVQIALLTSPAVYQRTRRRSDPKSSAQDALPPRPPLWLVLAGLLAGLVVTLLYLGNMSWTPTPGCGPPGALLHQLPARCIGIAQGYPLRFLTADQSTPMINKGALIKDWVQWSLISFSAFYLLWLRRDPGPPTPEPSQVSAGEQPVPE